MLLRVSVLLNHHQALAVCASLKLQYWCRLIYFVIKLFDHVAAY